MSLRKSNEIEPPRVSIVAVPVTEQRFHVSRQRVRCSHNRSSSMFARIVRWGIDRYVQLFGRVTPSRTHFARPRLESLDQRIVPARVFYWTNQNGAGDSNWN